jgi:hypothetical protein
MEEGALKLLNLAENGLAENVTSVSILSRFSGLEIQ